MARTKKPKPIKLQKPRDLEHTRRVRRLCAHLLLAALAAGGIGAGYYYADRYVQERVAYPSRPLLIVLKNRPPWMNDFLVEQIATIARPIGAHSAFDHRLLVDTSEMLARNPWVRKVYSVRRAYTYKPGDTLEIDCEYRAPVALVKSGLFYWLVDENSVRLSERFTEQDVPSIQFGPDGHTRIRVIEGARQPAPHVPGDKWAGEDLAAGLKMVNYLFGRAYSEDVLRVNVANFNGRVDAKDPQIVLETRYKTQIWWGRPPNENDLDSFIELTTARKLNRLRLICEQYGRVDARQQWVDIRFDTVGLPPLPEASPPANSGHRQPSGRH